MLLINVSLQDRSAALVKSTFWMNTRVGIVGLRFECIGLIRRSVGRLGVEMCMALRERMLHTELGSDPEVLRFCSHGRLHWRLLLPSLGRLRVETLIFLGRLGTPENGMVPTYAKWLI